MSHLIRWDAPFYQGFGGTNSVEIFFLISGFYIALILDKTYKSKKMFYLNRALRLYPIYLIVCFCVILTALFREGVAQNLFGYSPFVLAISTFSNLTMIGIDWLMFFDTANGGIHFTGSVVSGDRMRDLLWVAPAWSLGIEITFYALAPYLCKVRSKFLLALIGAIIVCRLSFNQSSLNFAESPFDSRFFPFELPFFLTGILLYRFKRDSKFEFKLPLRYVYLLLVACFIIFDFVRQKFDLSRVSSMSILIFATIVVVLLCENNEFDRKLGEISYPIYISHVFVSQVYDFATTGANSRIELLSNNHFRIISQVVIIIMVSLALLRITEPIERVRDKYRGAI
jgi:peptidoglycan/LPS O-acetylase OafA/YrhL